MKRSILIAWIIFFGFYFSGILSAKNGPMISPTIPPDETQEAQQPAPPQQTMQRPKRKRHLFYLKKYRPKKRIIKSDEEDED